MLHFQTALVKLIDQWMACLDKGDFVGALFIDFRKAFDVVDHSILIKKLSMYKIEEQSLLWFISYLNNRQQAWIVWDLVGNTEDRFFFHNEAHIWVEILS